MILSRREGEIEKIVGREWEMQDEAESEKKMGLACSNQL